MINLFYRWLAAAFLLLGLACFSPAASDTIASVGSMLLSGKDLADFTLANRIAPQQSDELPLREGDSVSAFVTTVAAWQSAFMPLSNFTLRHGREWKWKKKYYLSRLFRGDILQQNFGYSDDEVRNYYERNKNVYTKKIVVDSAGVRCTTMVAKTFDSVRWDVAKDLFLSNYTPDSGSLNLNDPAAFRLFREELYPEYFIKKFYKAAYGKPRPDSVKVLYGSGKLFTASDVETVIDWLPEDQRATFIKDPKLIINRLLQWTLFSERALATGYASRLSVRRILDWAWKLEVSQHYANIKFGPAARKNIHPDPSLVLLSYYDGNGSPGKEIDSGMLKNCYAGIVADQESAKCDSLRYLIRSSRGINFFYYDVPLALKEPSGLAHEADALAAAGEGTHAKVLYTVLADHFAWTPEGKRAMIELAKMASGEGDFKEAIRCYRRFLFAEPDLEKMARGGVPDRCNVLFRPR